MWLGVPFWARKLATAAKCIALLCCGGPDTVPAHKTLKKDFRDFVIKYCVCVVWGVVSDPMIAEVVPKSKLERALLATLRTRPLSNAEKTQKPGVCTSPEP